MKKLILILVVAVLVGGGYYLSNSNKVDYVATVDTEVMELVNELAELDEAVASGKLTPQEAVDARAKVAARLESINASVEASGNAKLSEAQKKMLSSALSNLYNNLDKYKSTLVTIDVSATAADEAGVKPTLNRGKSNNNRSLSVILASTVTATTDLLEEINSEIDLGIIEDLGVIVEEIVDDIKNEDVTESDDETDLEGEDGTVEESVLDNEVTDDTAQEADETESGTETPETTEDETEDLPNFEFNTDVEIEVAS